jgi:hypothetical protein
MEVVTFLNNVAVVTVAFKATPMANYSALTGDYSHLKFRSATKSIAHKMLRLHHVYKYVRYTIKGTVGKKTILCYALLLYVCS